MIHIGEIIEARLADRGMTKAEFGRRLFTSRQNVSLILQKESLNTALLTQICDVLNYDFFMHLRKAPEPLPEHPKMFLTVAPPTDPDEQAAFLQIVKAAI